MFIVVNKIGNFRNNLGNFNTLGKALRFINKEFVHKWGSPFCHVEIETVDGIISFDKLKEELKGNSQ